MLEFNNKDVAAKYTSTFKGDPVIHYPGGNNKNGWKKKLSAITLAEADQLFAMQNQNTLQLKSDAPAAEKKMVSIKPTNSIKEEKIVT